jgi:hypothetical protein
MRNVCRHNALLGAENCFVEIDRERVGDVRTPLIGAGLPSKQLGKQVLVDPTRAIPVPLVLEVRLGFRLLAVGAARLGRGCFGPRGINLAGIEQCAFSFVAHDCIG